MLSLLMHTWWQVNSDSRAHEREDHVLDTRSHVTMDYTVEQAQ